jgi:hypothetical protein
LARDCVNTPRHWADCFDFSFTQGRLCCAEHLFTFLEQSTMSTATLERKTDLHQLVLEAILMDSGVPLCHWTEWCDFVYYGVPRSDAARKCKGSAAALNSILTELSKQVTHKFPPKDWQPAVRKAS